MSGGDREAKLARVKAYLEADFIPNVDPLPASEHRIANALEYIAYHIGQIDKQLAQLVGALSMTDQHGPASVKQSLSSLASSARKMAGDQ